MSRRDAVRDLGRSSGLLALAAAGPLVGGGLMTGWAAANAESLRGGGIETAAGLAAAGFFGCALWVMPTFVLALVSGWALGWPWGFVLAWGTATLASPLGKGLSAVLAGPGVMRFVERYPRGAAVCGAVTRSSPWRAGLLVGLLRLSPVVPYGAVNVLAAAFRLRWGPFLWGTAIGMAPRVAAVAAVGAGLERFDPQRPGSAWLLGVGAAATVGAVGVLGWATRRALRRVGEE
ncbi:MAG: VTT domain-containing protein [Planctomycetota bacterium]